MRFIRTIFLAILALTLVVLAMANREGTVLSVLPDAIGGFFGVQPQVTLPLFVIVFVSLALGVLIGFVWEWLREHQHRAQARHERRERERLEREMAQRRRQERDKKGDDVLAMLEDDRQAAR